MVIIWPVLFDKSDWVYNFHSQIEKLYDRLSISKP